MVRSAFLAFVLGGCSLGGASEESAPPPPSPVAAQVAAPVPPPAPPPPPAPAYAALGDEPVLPVAGLAMPPVEGAPWQEITDVPWESFRALLASAAPISRGTRSGYRELSSYEEALPNTPRAYRQGGVHGVAHPGWWRPAPNVVVLVVPYRLIGRNGGPSLAFFGPSEGGVRYASHIREWQEGACPPIEAVSITNAADEWRFLNGCDDADAGATLITVRWGDGRLAIDERSIDPTRGR
jgi:hypothetical protein